MSHSHTAPSLTLATSACAFVRTTYCKQHAAGALHRIRMYRWTVCANARKRTYDTQSHDIPGNQPSRGARERAASALLATGVEYANCLQADLCPQPPTRQAHSSLSSNHPSPCISSRSPFSSSVAAASGRTLLQSLCHTLTPPSLTPATSASGKAIAERKYGTPQFFPK